MTLSLDPHLEAQETRELMQDMREMLLMRMRRKGAPSVRVAVIGKMLNHLDELEAINGPDSIHDETEGAPAMAAGQA